MAPKSLPVSRPLVAPRAVIGYHGCTRESAESILADNRFLPSRSEYDWLGEGFYFFEYAPYRALDWAQGRCAEAGMQPAVIRATIRLGRCLNLLDTRHIPRLAEVYAAFAETVAPEDMPRNTASGAHYLDRYVVNAYCRLVEEDTALPFQTVRGTFPEGAPIYRGSKILEKAHTQIAVRDGACILHVSLVEYPKNSDRSGMYSLRPEGG